jgi:hypothetical protein
MGPVDKRRALWILSTKEVRIILVLDFAYWYPEKKHDVSETVPVLESYVFFSEYQMVDKVQKVRRPKRTIVRSLCNLI